MKDVGKKKDKIKQAVKFSETKFYFANCPICRTMKKAEDEGRALTASELKKAFEKKK